MTVKELIEKLSKYDPNAEVLIEKYHRYSSDFTYKIENIEPRENIAQCDVVFLLEGGAEDEWDDEEDYEEE